MPFQIVRNDITNMRVDAIVNSANPRPVVGLGTDSAIHEKAGPRLLQARQKIGPIPAGGAVITPAYRLHAKYVIHTVGPVWTGGDCGEEALLRSCYDQALRLAQEHRCKSIAFPLISTNNYGFPKDRALQIAISAFSSFLMKQEMQLFLVVFDRDSFQLSEKLFHGIASYIDQHYVDEWNKTVYSGISEEERRMRRQADHSYRMRQSSETMPIAASECLGMESRAEAPVREDALGQAPRCPSAAPGIPGRAVFSCASAASMAPAQKTAPLTLEELLQQEDAGFSETLLRLIDRSGKKDSEIYKKANLSKQHFSKIRNNPNYKPTKPTALALAVALELDLEQTGDLIGRAGYTLTNSSKFDLIIRYFIEQGNYNVVEINIALYEFDQTLLGSGA